MESIELAHTFNTNASVSEALQSQVIQGKKSRVNWARKDPERIRKAVFDWDNVTGDFVGEDGRPLEKKTLQFASLSHKIRIPYKTLEKYLHHDKSKRRVIGGGFGMKAHLSIDDCDFVG